MTRTPSRSATAVPAVLLALVVGLPASAQEQGRRDRSCTLTLQPTDSTRSVSRKVGPDAYVTHLRNGMTWFCEPATMTADSAVQYERRDEVDMIGSVHYRDTTRDLRSRRLTYFQPDSRVLAEDSVRLRQLATSAVLRGPRVEFYNAVRAEGPRRTVATRRPTMRIPSPGDTTGEPFRVDADTAVFVGDRAAEAFGDVVIRRGSLTARGGYSRFRIPSGEGYLTRSPSVRGEGYVLTGDTIEVRFAGSELRTVRAVGDGHLETQDVEVRGPNVDVRVQDDQADELWAYGPGGARAFSAQQEIRGDSLHFDFETGRLTQVTAVGEALAMEVLPGEDPADDAAGARRGREDTAAAARTSPDSGAAVGVPAGPPGAGAGKGRGGGPVPGPGLDRSWIRGDTVRATFTAAGPDSAAADSASVDTLPTPGDSARQPPDSLAGPSDTVDAPPDTAAPARVTAATELERLVAIGNARSFYRIRRDSAETGGQDPPSGGPEPGGGEQRMARNYVIGDRITIRFRDSEPLSVHGTQAIGLFLEPVETPGGAAEDSAAARDSAAPQDTVPSVQSPGEGSPRDGWAGTLPRMHGIRPTGGMIYE